MTAEQLGGAKLHCEKSGTCDYFAETEPEALDVRCCHFYCDVSIVFLFDAQLQMCRELVADLNYPTTSLAFPRAIPDHPDILGLIPRDTHTPLPIKYEPGAHALHRSSAALPDVTRAGRSWPS